MGLEFYQRFLYYAEVILPVIASLSGEAGLRAEPRVTGAYEPPVKKCTQAVGAKRQRLKITFA